MTIAYVQEAASYTGSTNTASAITLTVGATTTAGNRLILAFRGFGVTISSITDSRGNTWAVDGTGGTSSETVTLASAYLTTALSTSDTISYTPSATSISDAVVGEYSGIAQTSYIDTSNAASSGSGSVTSETVSITPTVATDAVISAIGAGSAATFTAVSPTTARASVSGSANSLALGDDISAGTSPVSVHWTFTPSAKVSLVAVAYMVPLGTYPYLDCV
jgi:hypothetical protein